MAVTMAAVGVRAADIVTANDSEPLSSELDCTLDLRSVVYDSSGALVGELAGRENRVLVDNLSQIADPVIQSVLAAEDADFYDHNGVNIRAIARALVQNVSSGAVEQGGSTITQQLVKLCVLGSAVDLVDRKIPEAIMAVRLENEIDKDEILLQYLNTVYFGSGAYGVQAAAEVYFDKDASELTWSEGALLASLISSPVSGDPTIDADNAVNALERRNRVLERLVDLEQIRQAELEDFVDDPVPITRNALFSLDEVEEDYFLEEVKQILLEAPELGPDRVARADAIYGGGLRIYTTLDPVAQGFAEAAVEDVIPDEVSTPNLANRYFVGALAAVEPATGAVRSMVGGPGFDEFSEFNLATHRGNPFPGRPTGSSFKVFVLAAAMEAGYVPDDTLNGSGPCRIPNPGGTPDPYEAENFEGSRGRTGTIRSLTLSSSNCGYLRLGQIVGLGNVVDTAHALGVSSELLAVPSLPLGVYNVTPLEMAAAYAAIANDGVYNPPYFIDRVEDRFGNVIYEHEPTPRRAISAESARLVTSVLEDNVQSGTGERAQLPRQTAAGKTGTAQDFGDAWFVGYTPYLSTAVWMGNPDERVPMRGVGGRNVTGGSYPAMIWGQFNIGYHDRLIFPSRPFITPGSTRRGERIEPTYEEGRPSGSSTPRPSGGSDPTVTLPPASVPTATTIAPTDTSVPPVVTTPPVTTPPPPTVPPPTAAPPPTTPVTTPPPVITPPTEPPPAVG